MGKSMRVMEIERQPFQIFLHYFELTPFWCYKSVPPQQNKLNYQTQATLFIYLTSICSSLYGFNDCSTAAFTCAEFNKLKAN